MKNKVLLLLLLCAIPVASPGWGGHQIRQTPGETSPEVWRAPGDQAVSGIAFLLPQPDVDFSDLDVRDAQNHPANNRNDSQELETLFRENLVNLRVFAIPHTMAQNFRSIFAFSYLFNNLFFTKIVDTMDAWDEAILAPSRRFVHNGDKLCITFPVDLSVSVLRLAAYGLPNTAIRTILRC
jgi:hypothetical protein